MRKLWNTVIDMPPVWLIAFLVAVWLQTSFWNPLDYSTPFLVKFGYALIGAGVWLMILSIYLFWRHKTSVVPRRIPAKIITDGPYSWSRNPIYLADVVILAGYSISQGSVIGLLLVPVFMRVIYHRFINGEEAGMRREFGAAYETYCDETRRWL